MNIEYNLFHTKITTEEQKCQADNCNRLMQHDDPCYLDVKSDKILCTECGVCCRYERKMQEKREKAGIKKPRLIKGLDY